MKRLLLASVAALGLLASLPAAKAEIIGGQNFVGTGAALSLTPVVPGGNQPLNVQCIICGANQPQQSPTFGYTNFGNSGNIGDVFFSSTNVPGGANPGFDTLGVPYDGSFLRSFLLANGGLLTFTVGVDVNDTNVPQTLESFWFLNLTQHTVLASFSPGPGGTLIPSQNNGTGFPDYTLTGFDASVGANINAGDQLVFFARISGANDGPDSFFLIPSVVPGPIAGAGLPGLLALAGMMGFGGWRRFRRA